MTFLIIRNTNTVENQIIFSTTFSVSSLNKRNRGIPNAAMERVERRLLRGILNYTGFDEKLCLKAQSRQVHLHLPGEGDVNVLTKNTLPYAAFPRLRHATWLLSTLKAFWSATRAVIWLFQTKKPD